MTTTTRNGIPIACNPRVFSSQELEDHLSLALDVLFDRPKRTVELDDGFLLEYEGDEKLFLELARFVYNEHRCCPWESFALEMDPFAPGSWGDLRLRYTAGAEGKPIIAEAFQRFREAASDPGARQRLLAALRGTDVIDEENKGAFYEKFDPLSDGFWKKFKSACGC